MKTYNNIKPNKNNMVRVISNNLSFAQLIATILGMFSCYCCYELIQLKEQVKELKNNIETINNENLTLKNQLIEKEAFIENETKSNGSLLKLIAGAGAIICIGGVLYMIFTSGKGNGGDDLISCINGLSTQLKDFNLESNDLSGKLANIVAKATNSTLNKLQLSLLDDNKKLFSVLGNISKQIYKKDAINKDDIFRVPFGGND